MNLAENSYSVIREDAMVKVDLKDKNGNETWVRLTAADAVKLGDALRQIGGAPKPRNLAALVPISFNIAIGMLAAVILLVFGIGIGSDFK